MAGLSPSLGPQDMSMNTWSWPVSKPAIPPWPWPWPLGICCGYSGGYVPEAPTPVTDVSSCFQVYLSAAPLVQAGKQASRLLPTDRASQPTGAALQHNFSQRRIASRSPSSCKPSPIHPLSLHPAGANPQPGPRIESHGSSLTLLRLPLPDTAPIPCSPRTGGRRTSHNATKPHRPIRRRPS